MPLILGTNSIKDTGYDVANSARFDDGSSDNIQRTYGTPTNSKIFGLSWWIKLSEAFDGSASQDLWGERADGSNRVFMGINADGTFEYFEKNGGSTVLNIKTNRLFRDRSAWYHFLLLGDSTQGTDSNRLKLYINGVQETSLATASYPSSDYAFRLAINTTKYFGRVGLGGSLSTNYYDGYLAEAVFVDGTVTAHTDYGEFDEDSPTIWKPKDVSGLTFGTNGFYLDFENASSLGADVSGNSNNFTVNNLTSVDQSTDTCTNNFATMNPLDNYYYSTTFSEGNLKLTFNASNYGWNTSTFGLSQGKWYLEIKIVSGSSHTTGIVDRSPTASQQDLSAQSFSSQYGVNGTAYVNGSSSASYSTFTNGDIIGIALDLDNNKLYYSKNGTFQGSSNPSAGSGGLSITDPTSVQNGVYFIAVGDSGTSGNPVSEVNFGSPTFSISSGNSDGNGYGNFEYSVPSGYFSICTKNLAEFG